MSRTRYRPRVHPRRMSPLDDRRPPYPARAEFLDGELEYYDTRGPYADRLDYVATAHLHALEARQRTHKRPRRRRWHERAADAPVQEASFWHRIWICPWCHRVLEADRVDHPRACEKKY